MSSPLTDDQVRALPPEDLAALRAQVEADVQRRNDLAHLPAMIADLAQRYATKGGKPWPELENAVNAFRGRNNPPTPPVPNVTNR